MPASEPRKPFCNVNGRVAGNVASVGLVAQLWDRLEASFFHVKKTRSFILGDKYSFILFEHRACIFRYVSTSKCDMNSEMKHSCQTIESN